MLNKDILDLLRDQARDIYQFFNSEAVIAEFDYPLESYLTYPETTATLRDGLPVRMQYFQGRIMVHTGRDYSDDYIISNYSYWSYGTVTGKMSEYEIFYQLLTLFVDIIDTAAAFDYNEAV